MVNLPALLRPRSLRNCVIATVAAGFLLLTASQYFVAGQFVEQQLLKIESEDGFTHLRNLHHGIDQLGEDLALTTLDWAQWDAAYEYTTGKRPQFVSDNLNAEVLGHLRLDFLLVIDQHGRPVFARSLSSDGSKLLPPPADIVSMAEGSGVLSGHEEPRRAITGLVSSASGVYMVSSQPVQLSVPVGMPRGRMIMGRSVANYVVPKLRRMSGESVDFVKDVPSIAGDVLSRRGDETLILNDASLSGFSMLRDIWNQPVGALQLHMNRPIIAMLAEAREYLLLATVIVGIIFCLVALVLLRVSLIDPIEKLSHAVERIGQEGEAAARVPVKGTAEFQTLRVAINDMLHQVEQQQVMRRDRDAAIEANRLKSEFLATMSHEIRTPMNGVLGMCELLQRTDLTSRQKHLSDTILRSARSLLGMLNDVLDFSKIESGKFELESAPFSPAELMQSVSAPFVATAQSKGLEFSVRIEAGVPRMVLGDALRLRQILNNLLGNAIKFTQSGSVSISCAAGPSHDNRIELRFAVTDTGIGISPNAQAHIFDPFAQATVNTSRVYGGTGLGLAIVRRLVALMGGDISLQSKTGEGSTFTFTTVLQRAADMPSLRTSLADATGPRFSISNAPKVLLAEDNEVNREVFTEMLEHFGCRVTAVENGAQAVAAVADQVFDAILMDCQMPVMDGHTATTELRTLERTTAQKPAFIIALTADATPENHQRCLEAGMNAVVTKPISHSNLREVILRAVRPAAPSLA